MPVGEGERVGNAVGMKDVRVGNGVNVEKTNKGVGVACVPSVGKTVGLGETLGVLRAGKKGIINEQRQQNPSRNRAGIRTLTTCPCLSYIVTNLERKELICLVIFSIMSVKLAKPNFTLPFAILAASIIQWPDWKFQARRTSLFCLLISICDDSRLGVMHRFGVYYPQQAKEI